MEIVLWIYGFDFVWNELDWGEFGNLNKEVEIFKKLTAMDILIEKRKVYKYDYIWKLPEQSINDR